MKNTQRFWRALLSFTLLVAALGGSLALPELTNSNAKAAPYQQAAALCSSGMTIAKWTFDNYTSAEPLPPPSTGNGTFEMGNGLGGPSVTFPGPSGNSSDLTENFNKWATDFDTNDYLDFNVSTVGGNSVGLSFQYKISAGGPTTLDLYYSLDKTNFVTTPKPVTLTQNANWQTAEFDLSGIPNVSEQPNVTLRLYGYGGTSDTGTLTIDNVVICSQPMVVIEKIDPNPTNGDTILTWHAAKNGKYQVRVGGGDCQSGQAIVDTTDYQTSPSSVPVNVSGNDLLEGINAIRVCLTDDVSGNTLFATGSVTRDTKPPTIMSIARANGQAASTTSLPINFSVVFSEKIDSSSFTSSVVAQKGTAPGVQWKITDSGDHKTFTLSATTLTGSGTVTPFIDTNQISDVAGNKNQTSSGNDFSYTVTYTVPTTPTGYHNVIINEIAWSGTQATAGDSNEDEWIELYNTTNNTIDLNGWVLKADDGSPTITLKGAIAAKSYFLLARNTGTFNNATVDLFYGDQNSKNQSLSNGGEILRLRNQTGTVIDVANAYTGYGTSKWAAGTAASTYASMERGAYLFSNPAEWVTFAGTPTVNDRENKPVNGTPGDPNWINTTTKTFTTIISDTPDPSLVNYYVSVTVTVVGGATTPTGIVAITGASTNCSVAISSGMAACSVRFASAGTKTITATYSPTSGDDNHLSSSDTETHTVRTSSVIYPTLVPTAAPPPPLVAINEFVPRPGHDWNKDGIVNTGDEYIELLNHGTVNVNLSGYTLDDEVNVGSAPFRLPAVTLRPGERYVFYGSETGLLLGDGGDAVRLLKSNGQLADAYNYSVVERPDQSFCRLPDNGGADDWNQNCYPTPGLQNSQSEQSTADYTSTRELYCPIADTLPDAFAEAECEPFGNQIWRPDFWDQTGWYGDRYLPGIESKWPVFVN